MSEEPSVVTLGVLADTTEPVNVNRDWEVDLKAGPVTSVVCILCGNNFKAWPRRTHCMACITAACNLDDISFEEYLNENKR